MKIANFHLLSKVNLRKFLVSIRLRRGIFATGMMTETKKKKKLASGARRWTLISVGVTFSRGNSSDQTVKLGGMSGTRLSPNLRVGMKTTPGRR